MNSKRLFWLVLGSLGSLLACRASIEVSPIDQDGDKVADDLGVSQDLNGDGQLDTIDLNGDGVPDGIGVDTNRDGVLDAIGIDTDGDGIIDAIDTDGDGMPDLVSMPPTSGGAPSTGSGGGSVSGGAASGGSIGSGGGTITVGEWNAFSSASAASQLAAEYAAWRDEFLKTDCPGGVYSVLKGTNETVSEGIGYGMLITATLGTQAEFDGLLAFYQAAQKTSSGLMYWQCAACGSCGGGASATDGDLDVAMALLQADARFGGYQDEALSVITNLRKPEIIETCGSFTIMRPGEWGGCSDGGLINPSYFSPGYYRAFAKVDTAGASTWNALLDSSYELFDMAKGGHPDGLTAFPDAMNYSGSTFVNAKGFSYNGYDACRVPWRIAIDYAWSGDSRAKALLEWTSGEVDGWNFQMGGGLATDANSAFFGALALSGTAVSQAKTDEYYSSWMNAEKDDGPYYQATLRLVYLLVMAGQFPSTL